MSPETKKVLAPQLKNFMTMNEEPKIIEGKMFRVIQEDSSSNEETKWKACFYRLVGKEFYVYQDENSITHRAMHSLVGVFLKDAADDFDSKMFHSFKLVFPKNKVR